MGHRAPCFKYCLLLMVKIWDEVMTFLSWWHNLFFVFHRYFTSLTEAKLLKIWNSLQCNATAMLFKMPFCFSLNLQGPLKHFLVTDSLESMAWARYFSLSLLSRPGYPCKAHNACFYAYSHSIYFNVCLAYFVLFQALWWVSTVFATWSWKRIEK